MLFRDMDFHNTYELYKRENADGLVLQRCPKIVRDNLRTKARSVVREATGCEIRVVSDEKQRLQLFLSALGDDVEITIFRGDYFHSHKKIISGIINTITLEEPERFSFVTKNVLQNTSGGFSSDVWRVAFGRGSVVFYDVETFGYAIRPPRKDELPAKRWLAYGSSITHGANAVINSNCYAAHCAKVLGVDLLNRGMSGTCYIENEMADFFAEIVNDWDFATLELGVNVRSVYTTSEFKARVDYMVKKLKETNKPFALITVFPNYITYAEDSLGLPLHMDILKRETEFNEILVEIAKQYNIPCIQGNSVMQNLSYLGVDLLHPSPYGQMKMGENLANELKRIGIVGNRE